jgi:putative Mn2+ efflux pump MntP
VSGHPLARRRVSFSGIIFALVFLAIASIGVSGDPFWLLNEGTKWIAAGVLALIGIGLVVTTLPRMRKR